MGAYLSEPITDKVSSDEAGKHVKCGASSMQGWRVTQEDAHNCELNFDTNTSLFAVYDGHGGHEVAQYCAQYLPQYLKELEAYKKGDYTQALKDAFLGFDSKLASPEIVEVLKQIANNKDGENNSESDGEEEENVKNLKEEAEMPLEQVMAKYKKDLLNPHVKKLKAEGSKKFPTSPYLCARKSGTSSSSYCQKDEPECEELDSEVSSTSSKGQSGSKELECPVSESSSSNGHSKVQEEVQNSSKEEVDLPDSSADVFLKDKTDDKKGEDIKVESSGKPAELNGDAAVDVESTDEKGGGEKVTSSSTPQENGEVVSPKGKGKGKAPSPKKDGGLHIALRQCTTNAFFQSLLNPESSEDDDDDDEGDKTFEGADPSSDDDDDDDDDVGEGGEGDDDDDEDEDEDSGEDEDEDDEEDCSMKVVEEQPGADSGCTAVVALLKDCELYVANAGDSRCVVCRKGEAIEMSLDHKPEDETEKSRILKAGGKVTSDGRVNGGLNLSRALGDHAYKLNESLPAEEQMITALPDIRTLMIDPSQDEFMILACDGIWNFMSSQDVVNFVRPRIQEGKSKLSEICEELFDHCLAPNTQGDGTGCDNMTAVIIQFLPSLGFGSNKRPASPLTSEEHKRPKTEEAAAP